MVWAAGLLALLSAPLAASPPPELVEAVRTKDDERALALIEALPAKARELPRIRYLHGRLLERSKRPARALAVWPKDGAGLPAPVAHELRARRASIMLALGRTAQACPEIDTLIAEGERGAQLMSQAAECALWRGQPKQAIPLLRDAIARAPGRSPTARLKLAEALSSAGKKREAKAELQTILIQHPSRTESVTERLEELGDEVKLTAMQRLERAEYYLAARMHQRALDELAQAKPPRARRARAGWLHVEGMALFALRTRYEDAAKVLARAARLRGPTQADDAFHAARALARADKDRQAVRAFRRFAARYPRSGQVAEALYLAAWLELRHGFGAGERNMRRFVEGKHGDKAPKLARQGLFELGLRAFERRRYRQAMPLFARYAEMSEETMVRARGLYWTGRAGAAAGRLTEAQAAYRQATRVEPLHYYALLAAARLREAGADAGAPFADSPPLPGPAPLTVGMPDEADFYAGLGLIEDAREALRRNEPRMREAAPDGRGIEATCAAYHALDDYVRPRQLVLVHSPELLRAPLSEGNRWAWNAAYPRPFERELAAAAERESVPLALLFAIVRKESGFDPEVVSYANAVGLMQLLPKTAAQVAGVDDRDELPRDELFDPARNVELGARYIGQLLRRFDGDAVLAIAAYNAGPHKVAPWQARASAQDGPSPCALDLFVERIPIEQTRNYVRRVVSYWARYRYLEQPDAGWPLTLPLTIRSAAQPGAGAAGDDSSSSRRLR